ncbi:MAG: response regulator transcription factor [Candidatus Binatia bacterium]
MNARAIVYVVDDDPSLCASLRSLIESTGLEVETFSTGREFLSHYRNDARPACLVLDVRMPDMGGLQVQRELAMRDVSLPIIFTTAFANVPMAVRAMRKGAVDFLEKPFDSNALLERIHEALEVDRQRREKRTQKESTARKLATLSARERQVMDFVIIGKANKEIAYDLGLSQKTVEVHRARLMKKLEVTSLAALVRLVTARPEAGDSSQENSDE